MPKVLESTKVDLDRSDLHARSPIHRPVSKKGRLVEPTREKGIHLSGILRYVALESGIMKAVEEIDQEHLPLRMALGLAWEEFAASLYPALAWQPGAITQEGISMTCDGVSYYQESDPRDGLLAVCEPMLDEFKLTWKKAFESADEMLREAWYWQHQARGYCWGYDARLVRWHICFVNGNCRGSGPIYMRYIVLFSDEEIDKTAKMLLANRERAIAKGYAE